MNLEEFGETISSLQMRAGFTYIQCSPEPGRSLCKFFEDHIAPYLESSVEGKYCKGFCIFFFFFKSVSHCLLFAWALTHVSFVNSWGRPSH